MFMSLPWLSTFLKSQIHQIYFSRNRPILFYFSHQEKWCNIASLQGMQLGRDLTSMCVLAPTYQASVFYLQSRNWHFSVFRECNLHTNQIQLTSVLVVSPWTKVPSSPSRSYDQALDAMISVECCTFKLLNLHMLIP
jgi:hypothetical protein